MLIASHQQAFRALRSLHPHIAQRVAKTARPCVRMIPTHAERPASFVGGLPNVPSGFQWPTWVPAPTAPITSAGSTGPGAVAQNGRKPRHLSFLCQLSLGGSPGGRILGLPGLPGGGTLLLFADLSSEMCDPDFALPEDPSRPPVRVIYLPPNGNMNPYAHLPPPNILQIPEISLGAVADMSYPTSFEALELEEQRQRLDEAAGNEWPWGPMPPVVPPGQSEGPVGTHASDGGSFTAAAACASGMEGVAAAQSARRTWADPHGREGTDLQGNVVDEEGGCVRLAVNATGDAAAPGTEPREVLLEPDARAVSILESMARMGGTHIGGHPEPLAGYGTLDVETLAARAAALPPESPWAGRFIIPAFGSAVPVGVGSGSRSEAEGGDTRWRLLAQLDSHPSGSATDGIAWRLGMPRLVGEPGEHACFGDAGAGEGRIYFLVDTAGHETSPPGADAAVAPGVPPTGPPLHDETTGPVMDAIRPNVPPRIRVVIAGPAR
eukprot:TRINITY_DN8034_c0_g1_i1.p1 TRINITY_DN8034_c0_g1~~TRINITY_DN8034_c0_g1_i1.p1  ORF type:complete len:494 (+),score=66.39 TRINITY_DN8034_c0_g1_i1:122-1603(+)